MKQAENTGRARLPRAGGMGAAWRDVASWPRGEGISFPNSFDRVLPALWTIVEVQLLAEKNYFVPAIRYPTVPRGAARLRVTISTKHTPKQITGPCKILRELKTIDTTPSNVV